MIINLVQTTPEGVAARVAELTAAGVTVGRVNTMFCIVHGRAPPEVVEHVRRMPGVSSVADESRLWDRALFPRE